MKILDKRKNKTVLLGQVKIGTICSFYDETIMKIDCGQSADISKICIAVNLETGTILHISSDSAVEPLNAQLVIID